MATPTNRFDRVERPDPASVTVSLHGTGEAASGEVTGPQDGPTPAVAFGQDGSLSALQALAVACHLANQLDKPVVVMDPGNCWRDAWGRLEPI